MLVSQAALGSTVAAGYRDSESILYMNLFFQELIIFVVFLFSSLFRSDVNKAYRLKLGKKILPVYCHMTTLDGCGGGGWTLVMKMDGSKVNMKRCS